MVNSRGLLFPTLGALLLSACTRPAPAPPVTRLVDIFDAKQVKGSATTAAAPVPRTEWRFDGPPAATPARTAPSGPPPSPALFAATRGWEAGPGVSGLAIQDGRLVGKTTDDFPILRLERTSGLENPDQVHAIEVRMRVSGGGTLSAQSRPAAGFDLKQEPAVARAVPWTIASPVVAGADFQTYTLRPAAPVSGARIRYLLLRPTDASGADFAIESVRLVFRREHLFAMKSGVSWQGLRDVFRETVVTRAPETVSFQVRLPERPVLDLAMGSPEEAPVTFRVSIGTTNVMTHSVTTAHRWERRVVDLSPFAGQNVTLSLAADAPRSGSIAFWGAPAVRQRVDPRQGQRPQTVILIQGDTLRPDHLELYGYDRKTAPTLTRLANEGAFFRNAITQTSWTKAATPSVHTSLYPSTHGVHQIPDRLPSSAETLAEAYRAAGYATVSFSSVVFTGAFTNLHQGFEELHEAESTAGRAGPKGAKTAREYVDRLVDWLDDHRDVPTFVFLHVFDPHCPYEPNRPFDTAWADPKGRDEYLRELEVLKKAVKDPFMAARGMATPDELRDAGIDRESFMRYAKDWYDGSILGMDTELGRLVERLNGLALRDRTLLAFYADHGEEFHEHGRMFHGQTVYGEMIRVPLILWAPGRVPAGLDLTEPVQLIDVMPTLLDFSGLPLPKAAQGQSVRPLLAKPGGGGVVSADGGWRRRPVVAEKQPMGGTEHPRADESYAIMDGRFKLVQNVIRAEGRPELELFDFLADPHDSKNIAAEQKEEVARLGRELEAWKKMARNARLSADSEATKNLSAEQLEQLRSLGYVK